MAKPHPLNVRSHLEHAELILEGLKQYGYCPLIAEELRKFELYNKAILKKHRTKRAKGDRHDIRF